jgi:hypothetical protein
MKIFKRRQSNTPRRRIVQVNDDRPNISQRNFKRSRTLTGVTSSGLDGVGSNMDLKSSRTQVHNLSMKRRKIGIILTVVLAAVICVWILISNFTAKVSVSFTNVGISSLLDKQKFQNIIQDYLNDNPLDRFVFFMNQSNLSTYVSSKLNEVSSVTVGNMVGVGDTNFVITLRTPVAGWQIGNKKYYVDSNGIPFNVNYFSPPSVQIVDNSGVTYKLGISAVVSNSFLSFVGRVVTIAKASGFTVIQAS